jgi:hypothetical protein
MPVERVPPGVLLADTPVIRALRARATDAATGGIDAVGVDLSSVATIQVKLDTSSTPTAAAGSGPRVLLVKLYADDTIASLRQHVNAARPAGGGGYELRSAVPPRAYADLQQTLRQAGLMPNATLIVRPVVG